MVLWYYSMVLRCYPLDLCKWSPSLPRVYQADPYECYVPCGFILNYLLVDNNRVVSVRKYRCEISYLFLLYIGLLMQALSRRIHYGKFVAEAKFQESTAEYEAAIKVQVKLRIYLCPDLFLWMHPAIRRYKDELLTLSSCPYALWLL